VIRLVAPVTLLEAREWPLVLPLLQEVDCAARAGLWAAGFITYEAAPAFDRTLVTRRPGPLPLASFAIFERIERVPWNAVADHVGRELPELSWEPSWDAGEHARRVAAVKEAIVRGDSYQVNLTWRLRARFDGDPLAVWLAMLRAQAVPHAAYLEWGGHALCSASPELFLRRRGSLVLSRPMKGTAARGRFGAEDAEQARALAASPKERAENLMVTDMVRNDLSRVAGIGSVRVPRLFAVERYATLWQLTSTVAARCEAPLPEVLAAMFPSASITGAPKRSTMALIAELEDEPRGVYTGCIGWVGPGRRARFNVAIRTVWADRSAEVLEYGTGGGVTWDSSAAGELAEATLKARVVLAPPPQFELLETLRWSPRRGFLLLAAHLERLRQSARYFGFRADRDRAAAALLELGRGLPAVSHRVRLLVAADGRIRACAEPLPPDPRRAWRVCWAPAPIDHRDPLLFHKTTRRAPYDAARASSPGHDDVLLWNAQGELTESTIANVVVRFDDGLVTPPVESGLLPGTFRARLLARGSVVERVVHRDELRRASGLWLVNAVRGCVRAALVP
jgi:para-aminobenzoate synthetase / 4-amino-4-deoxychorismate lyase